MCWHCVLPLQCFASRSCSWLRLCDIPSLVVSLRCMPTSMLSVDRVCCPSPHAMPPDSPLPFLCAPPPSHPVPQVFDKALFEPHFCELYSQLCFVLQRKGLPEFEDPGG